MYVQQSCDVAVKGEGIIFLILLPKTESASAELNLVKNEGRDC